MWFIGKIRESMESIPLELSRYMGKSEEDICLPSLTSLSHNLPHNILTPDKIPEFCLPPRLCKRNLLQEAETKTVSQRGQPHESSTSSSTAYGKVRKNGDVFVALTATKKPLPFSAEAYGLAGMYESPNTRRKESLFLSKCPVYKFDRRIPAAPPKLEEKNQTKKTLTGFFPLFLSKSLSETGSTESEAQSSSDSSPLSSPYSDESSVHSGRLKGATSCPSLNDNKEDRGRWKKNKEVLSLTSSPCSPPNLDRRCLSSAHNQERLQRKYILPLQGRGRVHLLAELITSSNTHLLSSTVRVNVMSVEGVYNCTNRRAVNCALNLCLTPGMLQLQESATMRDSRCPVFNEDFFFTELSKEDLRELQLRLKVVGKPVGSAQRRGTVIGVVIKPLSELLCIKQR